MSHACLIIDVSTLCEFFLGGFYEKDKERLANVMAYGEDIPPPDWKKAIKRILPDDDYKPVDRFDECKCMLLLINL